jgi:hypothetical protein
MPRQLRRDRKVKVLPLSPWTMLPPSLSLGQSQQSPILTFCKSAEVKCRTASTRAPRSSLCEAYQPCAAATIVLTRHCLPRYYTLQRQVNGVGGFTASAQVTHVDNVTTFTFTDRNLNPFTDYTYFVTAVSAEGTNSGPHTTARTAIAAPVGGQAPVVDFRGNGLVVVNGTLPTFLNGPFDSMTVYLRGNGSVNNGTVICSTSELGCAVDVSSMIQPASLYEVRTSIANTLFSIWSPWALFTTDDAPPALSSSATPSVVSSGSSWAVMQWNVSSGLNGAILNVSIVLANATTSNEEILVGQGALAASGSFNLTGLTSSATYTAALRVCNSAGCSTTSSTGIQTSGEAPLEVSITELSALNDTAVQMRWTAA